MEDFSKEIQEIYPALRRIAAAILASKIESINPTGLVHEAVARLIAGKAVQAKDRDHLINIAANAMRQALVDQVRRRLAEKRGGGLKRITLKEDFKLSDTPEVDLLEFHDALSKLERVHPRQAKIVELRVFAGLSPAEIAAQQEVSQRTVEKDLAMARAWLEQELRG